MDPRFHCYCNSVTSFNEADYMAFFGKSNGGDFSGDDHLHPVL